MRRLLTCTLVLFACAFAAACGDDEADTAGARDDDREPFVTLAEAEGVIEKGALAVVRTGGDADVAGVDGEPDRGETSLVDAARYETQSGREFDLLVFSSVAAARRASPSVVEDDDSAIRAANVLTVFPARYQRVDAYAAVARAMRRLAVACERGDDPDAEPGEAELRDVCFDAPSGAGPEGEGVDRDEAQAEEEAIVVDGLRYDVQVARRLNPSIAPDEALVSGRAPPQGKIWFGVFLGVCNESEQVRTSSDRLALVDAFGQRTKPSDVLSPSNPFAYRPSSLEPDDCLPRPGTPPARNDGALVLFAVSPELLDDPPVALEVNDQSLILDL